MNKHHVLVLIIMTLFSGNMLAMNAKQEELKEAMQAVIGIKIALEQDINVFEVTEAELYDVVEQYNREIDALLQEGVVLSEEDTLHVLKWGNDLEAECVRLKMGALKI